MAVSIGRTPGALKPTSQPERIATLDILRGFALLGILLVNVAWFNASVAQQLIAVPPATWWDQAATWFTRFFAEGKFYPLFAFLFGLGFALQWQRAGERGRSVVPTYVRRLLILLVIGLAHITLLWYGDILTTYALLGFALVLFRTCRPRTLLIWAAIFVALPLLIMSGLVVLLTLALMVPESAALMEQQFAAANTMFEQAARDAAVIYTGGSFAEMIGQRISDLGIAASNLLFILPHVFALFLLGLYAGKRGFFRNIAAHTPVFRRALVWGLLIGLPLNFVFVALYGELRSTMPSAWSVAGLAAMLLGGPALSFAYIGGLTLLLQREKWRQRLAPLASVGRMALTNYLLQTLICTTIFYGWGLGLYGQVGPALGLLVALAIYAVQILLSVWWLKRFQYGPMEAVWRALTYGTWPSLRRPGGAAQPS